MKNTSIEKNSNIRIMKPTNSLVNKLSIKPKKLYKIKDARRLLANIIFLYQKGEVNSEYLKTLCYALIKYAELYKTETFENIEERLKHIEEKINEQYLKDKN